MMPVLETSLASIRETSESGDKGKLKTYGAGKRYQKKAQI